MFVLINRTRGGPVNAIVRPRNPSAMQQRKGKMRAVFVGGIAVVAILTCTILVGRWKYAADQEDMRTTTRLQGRWGIHLLGSPDNAAPEGFYEFMPDGRLATYGPDDCLLSDEGIQWAIRDGHLVWQIIALIPQDTQNGIPEDIHVNETERLQLQWNDEDTVTVQSMTDPNSAHVLLRRSTK